MEVLQNSSQIKVISVENPEQGKVAAKDHLLRTVSMHTALFLSGGKTPRPLYEDLVKEEKFRPRVVALVDERIDGSNEKMIRDTGLVESLEKKKIQFRPVLRPNVPEGVRLGMMYEQRMREIFSDKDAKKKIAVLGIGKDGHIAGIAPNRKEGDKEFENPIFQDTDALVGHFNDEGKFGYNGRITLTRKALEEMDEIVVIAFGEDKKDVVKDLLSGPERDYREFPAQLLRDIAWTAKKHVYLFTDQAA